MENKYNTEEELRLVSPIIAELDRNNIYSVPEKYFQNLADEVIEKINSQTEPVYHLSNINPYQVPADYFNNLSGKILEKIKVGEGSETEVVREMEGISPLLNTINKKPVFSVPAGYFDHVQMPPSENVQAEAKVVSITGGSRRIMKWAVAAVVACILGIGAFLFSERNSEVMQAQNMRAGVEVKSLTEKEIEEFLSKNAMPWETSAANIKDKGNTIKSAVKEVADKEIQQFLQENAVSDEI
ncbi:MAG TPA: hypothetical protein VF610_02905 [Segetibacter sp.]|jgi:hypothetical protein